MADKDTPVPVTVEDYAQRPHYLLVFSGGFVGVLDEALYKKKYKGLHDAFCSGAFSIE